MIRYGKTTQTAISAMSRLAEVYESREQLSSHDIARDREIAQTLAAKLLTTLSQAGLEATRLHDLPRRSASWIS